MNTNRKVLHKPLIGLAIFFLVLACIPGSAGGHESATLQIVASIAPLADMVHQIGRERVSVHQLVPPGVSPHTYEPVPSDLIRLSRADAFLVIGLGLEFFIDRLIQDQTSRIPVFEINQGIQIINGDHHCDHHHCDGDHHHCDGDHHHCDGDHHHGQGNPHIWLSLRNAQLMVDQIADILSDLDPDASVFYFRNAEEYRKKLADLDRWFSKKSDQFTSRKFVAAHGAWPYLARDYDLHQAGSIEQFPGREPTPREIRHLIDSIQQMGIRVVFAEPQLSQKAAAVMAEEAGVKLALLDPLGNYPDKPYLETMQNNLENILEALR